MNQAAINASAPGANTSAQSYRLGFHGTGGALFWEYIKNVFLIMITFGIYTFWANVNFRKYFWSNTELHNQRLSYHGTGGELFMGYLKLMGMLMGIGLVVTGCGMIHPYVGLAAAVAAFGFYLFLVPYALYSGRRYRLSRTAWRGIRFGMHDKSNEFAKLFSLQACITILTLGIWYPIMKNRIDAFRLNNTYWGDLQFRYTGEDKEVFRIWLIGALLCGLTLGLYMPWFMLKIQRYRAEHTWLGSANHGAANGQIGHTVWGFIWAAIKAELLVVVTLGFGLPWAVCMLGRYTLGGISLQGNIDFDRVKAVASYGDSTGDMLSVA